MDEATIEDLAILKDPLMLWKKDPYIYIIQIDSKFTLC